MLPHAYLCTCACVCVNHEPGIERLSAWLEQLSPDAICWVYSKFGTYDTQKAVKGKDGE